MASSPRNGITVIARLALNRSSECSEEAVKELDEAPIVYCLRSALNKQRPFDGLRANGVSDFPVRGVSASPIHGVLDFTVRGEQRYVRGADNA